MDREKKIPIYVNQINSEGILLEFDRASVVNWLHNNEIIDNIPRVEDLKAWFLSKIEIENISTFEGAEADQVTKNVFKLILWSIIS